MFIPIMKKYTLYKPTVTVNEYNESITTFDSVGEIEASIVVNTRVPYQTNGSNITDLELIGLTRDRGIAKGDKIDDYIVTFVEYNRRYDIIHMREIQNDGGHNY